MNTEQARQTHTRRQLQTIHWELGRLTENYELLLKAWPECDTTGYARTGNPIRNPGISDPAGETAARIADDKDKFENDRRELEQYLDDLASWIAKINKEARSQARNLNAIPQHIPQHLLQSH